LFAHLTQVLVAWGPLGFLLLSVLDSSGVPVAGLFDFLLIVYAAQRPPAVWWCATLVVIGSTLGNAILFHVAQRGGRQFLAKSAPEGRVVRFRAWFQRFGLLTVFIPALIPIPMPMKLFVIIAGVFGTPLPEFLGVVVVARTIRYFGEAWLGVALGHDSAGYLKAHVWQFVGYAALLFAVLYGALVLRHRATTPTNTNPPN
jgi:membrane protein YqaA with SNARE-associated domain